MLVDCDQESLIKSTLKLDDVIIHGVNRELLDEGMSRIVINISPTENVINLCPHCGKICVPYDTPRRNEPPKTWRSLDFANEIVVLQHKPHRVVCPDHGVVTAHVPWAYPNSCFTRSFEQQTVWLTTQMSKSAVAHYMRITWDTVGRCISRVRNDVEPNASERLNGLVRIGIDENAYGKGHNKFVMLVVNHLTNEVVWVKEGRSKDVIASFFEELTDEQRSTIQLVSADGAEWIHDVVHQYCPTAHICIDTFHIFEWITKAQNEVRLQEYRKIILEIKGMQEEKEDIQDDTEYDSDDKKSLSRNLNELIRQARENAALMKSGNFLFPSNPLNLSPEEILKQKALMALSPRLQRVNGRVGIFRDIMHTTDFSVAESEFNKWIRWTKRCRLESFKKLGMTLERFREPILNTIKFSLNNARVEANNNKIKALIRRSYGFRNVQNMIDLILLMCSQRYLVLPNRGLGEKGRSRWRVYRTNRFVSVG